MYEDMDGKSRFSGELFPEGTVLLAGTPGPPAGPLEPFAPPALAFLDELSRVLREQSVDPETAAFAFWCRRAHLKALRERHCGGDVLRLGRGTLFHLAPSNVPMMFAYTWAIGLLAGNAGIVRVSERTLRSEAVLQVLDVFRLLFDRPEHSGIRERTAFITYERSDAVTEAILQSCDGRVLWGGDETIRQMRRLPVPAHAVELVFPDRVSLALISEDALEEMTDEQIRNLVHRFYNDTYMMDQNGCSSPQTVIWLRKSGFDKNEDTSSIRGKWWEYLAEEAETAYRIDGFIAARKLEKMTLAAMRGGTEDADAAFPGKDLRQAGPELPPEAAAEKSSRIRRPEVTSIRRYRGNTLCVLQLSGIPEDLAEYKGGFGMFFETGAASAGQLFRSFSDRIQTVVCIGIEPKALALQAAQERCPGVLRFVEPGQALQMDTIWDGTDLIEALSRRIVF